MARFKPNVTATARLVLLQFVFADDPLRQDRTEFYPFFLGQARDLDVQAHWLHCGVYSYATSHQNAHLVHIDKRETEALVAGIGPLQPTHVIISEILAPRVAEALADAFPGARFCSMHDTSLPVQKYPPFGWLPSFLGLAPQRAEDRFLVDVTAPRYESSLVPPPPGYAPTPPQLLPIVCGPSCRYARPLKQNPYFREVELSDKVTDHNACSFCRRTGGLRYHYQTAPVELALDQCRRAAATANKHFTDVFRIRGAAVGARIGEFLREFASTPLPPSELCFEFRVDELLKVVPDIEAALPTFLAAGHRLNLYNAGLENFAEHEQERLNKGVTPDQVFAVLEHVNRWRAAHPDSVKFGNFGMIVFTPWTTLEDVATNLEGIRRLRELGARSADRYVGSKLQLFREIAIYDLARRDGVEILDIEWREGQVVDPETGFFWFDGHAKGAADAVELGWCFLHRETADFYEIVWRACMADEVDERAKADPLLRQVVSLIAAWPQRWPDVVAFLQEALDVARTEPRPESPQIIVERLAARLPSEGAVAVPEPTPMELLLAERADRLRLALEQLDTSRRSPMPGWRLVEFAAHQSQGARGFDIVLEHEGRRLALRLRPGDLPEPSYVATERIKLSHAVSTPVDTLARARAVRRLCSLLDYCLRHD